MIERRSVSHNALANVIQALASTGLLFVLYRYINTTLGVEHLGVWSVVLATASASRLADLGLSAGVTRFVARDRARDDSVRVGHVLDTAVVTLAVSVTLVLPLVYPLINGLLPYLFDSKYLTVAQQILPYALLSLWLSIIAAVSQGGLDGSERMDLRCGLIVIGQILMLVLAFLLVPRHGLVGLAWAQIGQGIFLLVSGRLVLVRILSTLPVFPRRWRWHVLREMLGYGVNVQTATAFMLLLDPVSKAMIVSFGGVAAAGYFEMASQVVQRLRMMIVVANQAIVPRVTALVETSMEDVGQLYRMNTRLIVFISLPVFSLLGAWGGGISWLLVGGYQKEFVAMLLLLTIAWGVNTLAAPAYFFNLGTGRVGRNTLTHVLIGIGNAGLGWLLGSVYDWPGVILGYALALVLGSSLLLKMAQRDLRKRSASTVAAPAQRLLPFVCLLVVAFGWLAPLQPLAGMTPELLTSLLIPPLAIGVAAWIHPMRRHLAQRFLGREPSS